MAETLEQHDHTSVQIHIEALDDDSPSEDDADASSYAIDFWFG